MTQISDAHKQACFCRKEQLKRDADKIYRSLEGSPARWCSKRAPEEVRHALDKVEDLFSGWTNKDYGYAVRSLEQYQSDLMFSMDQIANDVDGDRDSYLAELDRSGDPFKFYANNKVATENA